ncbi:MAG: histidine kinase [Lysobacterales bacterium]
MRWPRWNHIDLLRYAGLFTYLCVGLPMLQQFWLPDLETDSFELRGWWASYLAFGVSYWVVTRDLGTRRPSRWRLPLLLVMNIASLGINYFSESALAGILLVVISGVLPWMMPLRFAIAWAVLSSVSLIPTMANLPGWTLLQAILQSALYLGFTSFTFVTALVAKGQAEAREEQRRLNAELRATRELLAESSRMGERVRISRELHDLLGHHLTALSLNLEVASHIVDGAARERVRQAQTLAKLLLADVREAVSQLRHAEAIDLRKALTTLTEGVPGLRIHLDMPAQFAVEDPQRAQVLLRCAQETITNAVRHAGAANLWLRFERDGDNVLHMHARDDGIGSDRWVEGNGLIGMRERLARFGGRLDVAGANSGGRGFVLEAMLPLEKAQ